MVTLGETIDWLGKRKLAWEKHRHGSFNIYPQTAKQETMSHTHKKVQYKHSLPEKTVLQTTPYEITKKSLSFQVWFLTLRLNWGEKKVYKLKEHMFIKRTTIY